MKLLLVTHFYPPEIGAPQRRWEGFVGHWTRSGIDVTVVCPLPHYPDGKGRPGSVRAHVRTQTGQFGERIVRVPFVPNAKSAAAKLADHSLAALASIPAAALRPFDVVLTSAPGLPGLVAGEILARMRHVPHVVEMRDAWPDLLDQAELPGGRAARGMARVVTRAQSRADRIVTVSAAFADVLRDRHPAVPVDHVSNGITVDNVPEIEGSPLGEGPIKALYLGTMGVSQGLHHVIDAASIAGSDVVSLTMIGGGNQTEPLRRHAAELGVPVTFRPQVSGEELWAAYAGTDTVAVPLRAWPAFDYTVPSKLYEIFAAGIHVSAMLSGEAREMVHDSQSGFCVPPEQPAALASKWTQMHDSRTLLGQVPGASRDWVRRHADYEVLADRYASILRETVDKGKTR